MYFKSHTYLWGCWAKVKGSKTKPLGRWYQFPVWDLELSKLSEGREHPLAFITFCSLMVGVIWPTASYSCCLDTLTECPGPEICVKINVYSTKLNLSRCFITLSGEETKQWRIKYLVCGTRSFVNPHCVLLLT